MRKQKSLTAENLTSSTNELCSLVSLEFAVRRVSDRKEEKEGLRACSRLMSIYFSVCTAVVVKSWSENAELEIVTI